MKPVSTASQNYAEITRGRVGDGLTRARNGGAYQLAGLLGLVHLGLELLLGVARDHLGRHSSSFLGAIENLGAI